MPDNLRELETLPGHGQHVIDPKTYTLRVDGLAGSPLALSIESLRAMPQVPFDEDFVCLEGWVAPDQHWEGVPLMEVLHRAAPAPEAAWVTIEAAADDFSLPLPVADAERALLALSLEGQPLTPEHGAPVRLVVPGGLCFTSVKWVDHIELRATQGETTGEAIARARIAAREIADA